MIKSAFSFLFISLLITVSAQKPVIATLTSGTKTSLRGLSVVNDNVVWVSGSNGTVGRSLSGGKSWKWFTVKGFEKTDFRDVEAFDASTAIIMGIGEPAYILKTTDGGESWKVVYENTAKGMFLDAMDFFMDQYGIVIGDPINNKVFIAKTRNQGDTWEEQDNVNRPDTDSGEAFFAASGSIIKAVAPGPKHFFAVSGGMHSNLFFGTRKTPLPFASGKESTGANAFDIYEKKAGKGSKWFIVVGGDFTADSSSAKNCFYSRNNGKNWIAPEIPPQGYRSCVEYLSKKKVLTCGQTGVDFSRNGGKTWQLISKEGFHVCKIAKRGSAVFLAGSNGRIALLTWKR